MSSWSSEEEAPSLPSFSYPPSPSSSVLRQFSLAEIRKATNNFDQAQLLRRGWSIEVYKGTYDDYDGTEKIVVIKCLNYETTSRKSFLWFGKEVEAWSQYRHKHVVPVIGYCSEGGAKIVVYEYMQNGSLANNLCTKITPASFCLSSEQCLQICIDAARGLEYMHTGIRYPSGGSYFLGDVRLSNILLDGNGVAKISDLFYEPFTRDHESAFVFDPEYHSTCIRERSSDVYAFGMLLVKVLARKVSFDNEDMNLGKLFKKSINNGTIHQIIHPVIKEHVSHDCLEALIQIAGECLKNGSMIRPSMTQVVKKLELLMTPSSQRLCRRYSLTEIKDVTNNFQSNILGQGGEGTVYKGLTKTNTTVAVKRLKPERSPELEKEIKMLSNLDHPNLVSLVGYCQDSDENILVYEFMSNGNLSKKLYGASSCLSWKQRLNICVGAARGLRYLHNCTNSSRKGIIHRDVKPVNILLDEDFNAKISDFGLSRMGTDC